MKNLYKCFSLFFLLLLSTVLNVYSQDLRVYDISKDWSYDQNPNGAWSYNLSLGESYHDPGTPITDIQTSWNPQWSPAWPGDFLNGQIAWAYHATEPGNGAVPGWARSDGNTGLDLPEGTVFAHAGLLSSACIAWTSPFDGIIDIEGELWLAAGWPPKVRFYPGNVYFRIFHNNEFLTQAGLYRDGHYTSDFPFNIKFGYNGSEPLKNIQVQQGDIITLQLLRSTGDGNYVGVRMKIIPLNLVEMYPNKGGDTSTVTVRITGGGFEEGAQALLYKEGEPDIIGENINVDENGLVMYSTFDLNQKSRGLWNLLVTNPNGSNVSLIDAFTIEEGKKPQVWVDIIGPDVIRHGVPRKYHIFYGNRGNVDAIAVPLWIGGIPTNASINLNFDVLPPLPIVDSSVDYSQVPTSIELDDEILVPLLLPVIKPGYIGVLSFDITVPNTGDFQLRAWTNPPFFSSPVSESTIKCITTILTEFAEIFIPVDNDCVKTSFNSLLRVVYQTWQVSKGEKPINLSWTLGNFALSCLPEFACLLCVPPITLTPPCVVCYTSKGISFIRDIVSKYKTIKNCSNTSFEFGEAIKPIFVVNSIDPNIKTGSSGFGEKQFISGKEPLRYAILFENDESATAPAQEVIIIDHLDSEKLDLSTINFGPINFGDKLIKPTSGSNEFKTTVDLRPELPLLVNINCSLDSTTGLLKWHFKSIDPTTGTIPQDPLLGFLFPNINPPEGDGSVLFTIMPKSGISNGTEIYNAASIIFDNNDPIETQNWLNTIDNSAPVSSVNSLPNIQTSNEFDVSWVGSDEGAGIKYFTIFVSENDGPFVEWLPQTSQNSETFIGEVGNSYSFYSVATDYTNNIENPPTVFDASTTVASNQPPVAKCQNVNITAESGISTAPASIDAGSFDPDGDPITIEQNPPGPYQIGITAVDLIVTDDKGLSSTCNAIVTVNQHQNDIDEDQDGFTENQGDCNDADNTIYPGAEEICDDQIDNNCDGQVDEGCGNHCGDANSDGVVNQKDLIFKLNEINNEFKTWKNECYQPKMPCGDFDGDGKINLKDPIVKYAALMKEYYRWYNECWKSN